AGEDGEETLPDRAVGIGALVVGIDVLGEQHALDLDEAAKRDRTDGEVGLAALAAEDRRPETDREALDPHLAPAGDEVVSGFVDDDQEADGEDRPEEGD